MGAIYSTVSHTVGEIHFHAATIVDKRPPRPRGWICIIHSRFCVCVSVFLLVSFINMYIYILREDSYSCYVFTLIFCELQDFVGVYNVFLPPWMCIFPLYLVVNKEHVFTHDLSRSILLALRVQKRKDAGRRIALDYPLSDQQNAVLWFSKLLGYTLLGSFPLCCWRLREPTECTKGYHTFLVEWCMSIKAYWAWDYCHTTTQSTYFVHTWELLN